MSTELATIGQATSLPDKIQYAKALADASLLPRAYQKQPGNVLLAIEMGEALGLHPYVAIQSIHIIEGKPTASSALISALVRRAGHKLRVSGDGKKAVAEIVRADGPDFTYRSEWDLDRARAAGLAGKTVWKQYPAAMLKARAITEVARDACQEALSGVQYTPEELGAQVDEEGAPVDSGHVRTPPESKSSRGGVSRLRSVVSEPQPAGEETVEAEIVEEPADTRASRAQIARIHELLAGQGIGDREAGLAFISGQVGREITHTNELTVDDAEAVLAALEALVAPDGVDPETGEVAEDGGDR